MSGGVGRMEDIEADRPPADPRDRGRHRRQGAITRAGSTWPGPSGGSDRRNPDGRHEETAGGRRRGPDRRRAQGTSRADAFQRGRNRPLRARKPWNWPAGSSPTWFMLDIMLGEGRLDGIEAAEIIRERFDIPVVFITAYGNEQIIDRAKTVDPLGFISKPFFEDELKACVELALYKVDRDRTLQELGGTGTVRSWCPRSRRSSSPTSACGSFSGTGHAAGMFGHTAEEIEQRPVLDLISEPQQKALSVEMDRMVLTEEKDTSGRTAETVGLRKDGSEFPMEFSLSSWVVRDDIFFTINARDITDRKKVDQMKTDFVSLVSHQLKTPVAGVLGCIDNLLSGIAGPITPEQREYLLLMRDISLRNYRNVNDLLNVVAHRARRGRSQLSSGGTSSASWPRCCATTGLCSARRGLP
ncbi:MAG: PAS domain S-box protein [Rhodopseudomonas palustris]|nr:PAS domain S-box protein [Rhodopseudomonas palustris]